MRGPAPAKKLLLDQDVIPCSDGNPSTDHPPRDRVGGQPRLDRIAFDQGAEVVDPDQRHKPEQEDGCGNCDANVTRGDGAAVRPVASGEQPRGATEQDRKASRPRTTRGPVPESRPGCWGAQSCRNCATNGQRLEP